MPESNQRTAAVKAHMEKTMTDIMESAKVGHPSGHTAQEGANMVKHTVRAVGIAWYLRQDYRRILDIMEDADVLPPTYDTWRQKADQLLRHLKRQGQIAVEAVIDPDEFPRWCKARGLNVDAVARNRFASEFAYEQIKQTH